MKENGSHCLGDMLELQDIGIVLLRINGKLLIINSQLLNTVRMKVNLKRHNLRWIAFVKKIFERLKFVLNCESAFVSDSVYSSIVVEAEGGGLKSLVRAKRVLANYVDQTK